jgi:16S rRNA (cytosine1402-N4)-methyltransferase
MAEVHLLGIDRDPEVLELAAAVTADTSARVDLVCARMSAVVAIARAHDMEAADGVLMDLGVSSIQLDDESRGFSFRTDTPLDMRMNRRDDIVTARDLVNQLDENTLEQILREYGEERYSRRIARGIVTARQQRHIATTNELATIVARSVPARSRHGRIHVATRTFQALRMAVNEEPAELDAALAGSVSLLAPRGRIVIIAFHSLEDRPVKAALRRADAAGELRLLGRKVLRPEAAEVQDNARARSARLRAAERPPLEDVA